MDSAGWTGVLAGRHLLPDLGTGHSVTRMARSAAVSPSRQDHAFVAHHPTTPTDRPAGDATFQIAGTARERPEIGIFCPVDGSTS